MEVNELREAKYFTAFQSRNEGRQQIMRKYESKQVTNCQGSGIQRQDHSQLLKRDGTNSDA